MSNQPRDIQSRLEGRAERAVRRLELRVFQVLTSGTPVDTGFARSSLTPTVGSPITQPLPQPKNVGTRENPGSGRARAMKEAASRFAENKSKSNAIGSSYKLTQGSVFMVYRAQHVVFLNGGSSSQAPKNFIERGISTAIRSL